MSSVESISLVINACALGMILLTLALFAVRWPFLVRRGHFSYLAACLFLLLAAVDLVQLLISNIMPATSISVYLKITYALFILYPAALWIYIRVVTDPNPSLGTKDLWHLLPVPVFLMLSSNLFSPDATTLIGLFVWLGTIICYGTMSLARLSSHRKRIKHISAANETVSLSWLARFVVFSLTCGAIVFVDEISGRLFNAGFLTSLPLAAFNISLIGGFCFFSLTQGIAMPAWGDKADLDLPGGGEQIAPYARSPLSPSDCQRILAKLDSAMLYKSMWRNPNLSLKDLSDVTGVSLNNISQSLNTQRKVNFYDYVNGWRIKEACQKLDGPEQSILEIAMEVGFNSKSTFNSAFKRARGMTPSAHRATQKSTTGNGRLVRTGLSGR